MAPKTWCQYHGSQLRTTNQQVHWVVQVIPYVSKGQSHGDYWFEAINVYFINLSQEANKDLMKLLGLIIKIKEGTMLLCFAVLGNMLEFWRCFVLWLQLFLEILLHTQSPFHGKLYVGCHRCQWLLPILSVKTFLCSVTARLIICRFSIRLE